MNSYSESAAFLNEHNSETLKNSTFLRRKIHQPQIGQTLAVVWSGTWRCEGHIDYNRTEFLLFVQDVCPVLWIIHWQHIQ